VACKRDRKRGGLQPCRQGRLRSAHDDCSFLMCAGCCAAAGLPVRPGRHAHRQRVPARDRVADDAVRGGHRPVGWRVHRRIGMSGGLLGTLTERGIKWAIATSGRARPALRLLGLPDDAPMVTRDMVAHAKPDPDLFLAAAALLDADPRSWNGPARTGCTPTGRPARPAARGRRARSAR
jgi:hypothetical protein